MRRKLTASTCRHCGKGVELGSGLDYWRHADPPHTRHCVVNGVVCVTVATPEEGA
jgi:hypothetical protein